MAVLIGMSGDVKGKTFTLDSSDFTVGRSSDNTVSINNATVSSHHCRISLENEHYVLRDLGSTNGTRVNTKDVTEHTLHAKDLVQVGSVEFLYNSEDDADPVPEDMPMTQTEVIVGSGRSAAPESFESISPFGTRQRENPGVWMGVIVVLALAALAGVGYLIFRLFFAE
jgi:pSer/pThr/pTyr-binding forkhead associated (FHA) protein